MIANQPRLNAILPFASAQDLSDKKGYAVSIDDSQAKTIEITTGVTDLPFGVITYGANTEEKSSVACSWGGTAGTVYIKLSDTVSLGDDVGHDADGKFTTSASVISAIALENGVAGELIEAVLVKPYS